MAWCLGFILVTSFRLDGKRYFCLFEDAMIGMTYARNLAEGHGLTWARWGEPVEGCTAPLWPLAMVLAQIPGVPLSVRPLLVQLASLVLLVANVILVFRLCRRHLCPNVPGLAWVAAFATAAYYPLNYWALVGMETGAEALVVTAALSLAFDGAHAGRHRVFALWCTATVAVMLRPDMVIAVVLIVGYATVHGGFEPSRRPQWWRGVAVFGAVIGGYQVFRLAYYGDVLPNTYWLKMTGGDPVIRIHRGFLVFLDTVQRMPTVLAVCLVGGLVTGFARRQHLLLVALVVSYFAYSIYVGGDMYEFNMTGNRFVCFVLPLLACLAVGIADVAVTRWPRLGARRAWPLGLAAGLWLFVSLNGLLFGTGADIRRGYLLLGQPLGSELQQRVATDIVRLRNQLPADTKVSVIWAGIPAYFSDFRMIDPYGFNDRVIGRGPWALEVTRDEPRRFAPGHLKWDLDYTLETYEPDVFFQISPEWADRLCAAGYRRYLTGSDMRRAAGQMWARPPLTIDTSPWQD